MEGLPDKPQLALTFRSEIARDCFRDGSLDAFQAMAASGQGGLGAVSKGISEALITTAAGLLVAIPAVMAFNYFTNTIEQFVVDMNDVSSELISYVLREGRER